jgi:signal transduction histidine kinase
MFFLLRLRFIIAPAILFLLCSTFSFGQKPYLLTDTTISHRLDAYTEVLVDSLTSFDINQITQPGFQHSFQRAGKNLTFGYLKAPVWLKIVTRTASPETQWYLEIPAPFLEYVDFYQLNKDNTYQHSESGYYREHTVREISHTSHALSLQFTTDSLSTVYIRIAGESPKTFPLFALEKELFYQKTRFEDVGYGIFFGILVVMFFYNLLLYLTLKQVNYLLYICTIVCTFIIFSSASGYAGKFLWPGSPVMNFYAGRMSLGALAVFLSVFTIRFLEVKKYSKVMYYALASLIPLALIATFLVATDTLSSAGNNLISLSTLVFMTTGIVCRVNGNKTASYFIAAWTVYLIGGLFLTLRNSGFLDFNFWTTHFVEIGAALETIIIAFALGDRYRRYKQEKEEVQLLALKAQQEANEILEVKVKERTEQLSKAYEELRATLDTNTLQTKIIENKNAELDAFFYRISHDLKGPISSLLGLSALARRDVTDIHALEYMQRQHDQVERMNAIITGLINLTKLSHSDLKSEKIDFEIMIDACIRSFNGLDNFEKLSFQKEIPTHIIFYSEWTLLNAILQNLIENAIKYSREESPFVRILIHPEPDGGVCIEVGDNGQGIPAEDQSRVFEMFYRATQNATGTGLGLYILKRSVDRLMGTVSLKSEVGVGSTFTVKLPSLKK